MHGDKRQIENLGKGIHIPLLFLLKFIEVCLNVFVFIMLYYWFFFVFKSSRHMFEKHEWYKECRLKRYHGIRSQIRITIFVLSAFTCGLLNYIKPNIQTNRLTFCHPLSLYYFISSPENEGYHCGSATWLNVIFCSCFSLL